MHKQAKIAIIQWTGGGERPVVSQLGVDLLEDGPYMYGDDLVCRIDRHGNICHPLNFPGCLGANINC